MMMIIILLYSSSSILLSTYCMERGRIEEEDRAHRYRQMIDHHTHSATTLFKDILVCAGMREDSATRDATRHPSHGQVSSVVTCIVEELFTSICILSSTRHSLTLCIVYTCGLADTRHHNNNHQPFLDIYFPIESLLAIVTYCRERFPLFLPQQQRQGQRQRKNSERAAAAAHHHRSVTDQCF